MDRLGRSLLPNFAKSHKNTSMSSLNVSLPESLNSFVDEQVTQRGFGTSSEVLHGQRDIPAWLADDAHFEH